MAAEKTSAFWLGERDWMEAIWLACAMADWMAWAGGEDPKGTVPFRSAMIEDAGLAGRAAEGDPGAGDAEAGIGTEAGAGAETTPGEDGEDGETGDCGFDAGGCGTGIEEGALTALITGAED